LRRWSAPSGGLISTAAIFERRARLNGKRLKDFLFQPFLLPDPAKKFINYRRINTQILVIIILTARSPTCFCESVLTNLRECLFQKHMHRKLFLTVIILLGLIGIEAQTMSPVDQTAEKARIERLVGLAKIWGTVKYFHPYPAYREIDWDKALIDAIPRVNAAKTSQEYEAAVNSMLAVLGDKSTRAKIGGKDSKTENRTPAAKTEEPIRLENEVLMIDAVTVADIFRQENNRLGEFLKRSNELLPQTKAVLIDLRRAGAVDEAVSGYFLDMFLRSLLPALLDRDVSLGSLRYRIHNGYTPQSGSTSGGYYSALMSVAPETLAGNSKTKTPPLIFLSDEDSPATEILGGLQAAKLAFVIQDGEASSDAGAITTILRLPEAVEVKMRTAELVNPDGTVGFSADLVAPQGEALKAAQRLIAEKAFVSNRAQTASAFAPQTARKENTYAEMEFPPAEYRLLALFRFWNVINYFFPYKDLTGTDWNDVLARYIPKFEANRNAFDYQITVRELAAETHDSHVGVRNAKAYDEKIGLFTAPVILGYLENQTIVSKVLDEKLPLKVGDVVLAIDGEPVEKRREFFSRITAASTPQALMYNIHFHLLRGQKDSLAKLTVRGGADGKMRDVEIARTLARQDPKIFDALLRSVPKVQILPGGFGYVDLERLTVAEVDKMFETVKNAPAVIFDMRDYPNGTAWEIAPRLTSRRSPVGALFSRPITPATSFYDGLFEASNFTFAQTLPEVKGDVYTGKVVMLINEKAISQAEHTALFFEAARPDIKFIGTPTMGANGDVTTMVLPGNLVVSFSGHSVRHADGRQLQRIGIEPTVKVSPTIRGLREGRDEILDAAIKFLRSN
jgi:C-terminal processing protease CtpA/Prc